MDMTNSTTINKLMCMFDILATAYA